MPPKEMSKGTHRMPDGTSMKKDGMREEMKERMPRKGPMPAREPMPMKKGDKGK